MKKKIRTYIDLYEAVFTNDPLDQDDPRRQAIADEMKAVVNADTVLEGTEVIEWWGWNTLDELKTNIRKIRRLWRNK